MRHIATYFLISTLAAALAACGGGGGGSSAGGGGTSSNVLSGLAAVGAAIAGGNVTAKCVAGPDLTGTTDSNGNFSLTLTAAHTAPCMLQVTKAGPPSITLHSFATAAGQVNISPLTDLVVTKALGSDPATAFNSFGSSQGSAIASNLATAKAYVQNQVNGITGATPSIDPMAGTFVVGDANDKILDALGAALQAAPGGAKTIDNLRTAITGGSGDVDLKNTVPAYLGAPSGVTATANSSSQITVNWSAVTGATGYNVYRSTSANVAVSAGNKITSSPVSSAGGYVDSAGLVASTTYFYKVTATGSSVTESAASNEASTITSAAGSGGNTGNATLPTGFVARANPANILNTPSYVVWTGTEFVALEQSTAYHTPTAKFFVWKSADGITWSRDTTDLTSGFMSVSTANGKVFQLTANLAAVGASPTVTIAQSSNGVNWTSSTADYVMGPTTVPSPMGVKYLNGRYFASLDVDTCMAISSADAATWTSVDLKALALPSTYYKVPNNKNCSEPFYIGGKYRIYGGIISVFNSNPVDAKGLVYSSTDGTNWTVDTFALPTGANAVSQTGRTGTVIQIGSTIVLPSVMAQESKRINPTDTYPTLVTNSNQIGTSTDGVTFTFADAVGISYRSGTVGKPGLTKYFTDVDVPGSGILGMEGTTNFWTTDGVNYTTASQGYGLTTSAINYAYSPTLKRLVVIQRGSGLTDPTIMTKDF